MEVINRQIDAYNKVNPNQINRIESPTINLVNNARPQTQKLFTDNPTTASAFRGASEIVPGTLQSGTYMRPSMKTFITGATGLGTGPHADFRVWDKALGKYIDPTPFMSRLSVNGAPVAEQYRMTSPYGMRTHPVTGEYKMHFGIDYATPVGTTVDVDANFLETIRDPTAGNMGIYGFNESGREYELHALHGN